jgi:hypothetical protein
MSPRAWPLAGACVLALAAAAAASPLEANLKVLQQRARSSQKPAPAARPARAVRHGARPRMRMAHAGALNQREPILGPATRFVSYGGARFGAKPRGGDLIVKTNVKTATHVYVKQRLVSNEGNGEARVPDLAPGKVPILVWSPEAGKRRTFWVAVRPGQVAQLDARL